MAQLPPILAFAAPSGTGKTTLITSVIEAMSQRGMRVAVLKHDAHRLELDKPGKDTWRFRQAGAWRAVIASEAQLAVFSAVDGVLSLGGLVQDHLEGADFVLAEGFRKSGLPTLRIDREGAPSAEGWEPPGHVIAWVSDRPVDTLLPVLPLDGGVVAEWILSHHPRRAVPAATLVLPVADARAAEHVGSLAARFGPHADAVLVVSSGPEVAGLPLVRDLRPDLGPLGALLTALACVDTPDVLFVGARHAHEPVEVLLSVRHGGSGREDVVVLEREGYTEPLFARYGHRCLSAIKGALLSGERKMDGWWGQVRVGRVR